MRAERSSPTPFGFELALEKPWHGEPPAKRTCSTVLFSSRMDLRRAKSFSARARTEPFAPLESGSSES